jgi:hypothetical protein
MFRFQTEHALKQAGANAKAINRRTNDSFAATNW